ILLIIAQTLLFVSIFMLLYLLVGIRGSPIRGDFMLYLMSGIFLFMSHVRTVGAASSSHSPGGGLIKHPPLNPAVLIAASALSTLYGQSGGAIVLLGVYHITVNTISIYFFPGALAM